MFKISSLIIILIFQSMPDPDHILGEEKGFFNIKDVVVEEDISIILTSNEPFVSIFNHDGNNILAAFGKEGQGPGELQNPAAICTDGDIIYLIDSQPGKNKLMAYTKTGQVVYEKLIKDFELVTEIVCNEEGGIIKEVNTSINQNGEIVQNKYSLYSLNNQEQLREIPLPSKIKLNTRTGAMKSISIPAPFSSTPKWTISFDGLFTYWDGQSQHIEILSSDEEVLDSVLIPDYKIELTDHEINFWLNQNYDVDKPFFGMYNIYSEIHEEILKEVEFPEYFPKVSALKGDAANGWWILHAQLSDGEIWSWLKNNTYETYKFPPDRKALSFGKSRIAMSFKKDDRFEVVELYRKNYLEKFILK